MRKILDILTKVKGRTRRISEKLVAFVIEDEKNWIDNYPNDICIRPRSDLNKDKYFAIIKSSRYNKKRIDTNDMVAFHVESFSKDVMLFLILSYSRSI